MFNFWINLTFWQGKENFGKAIKVGEQVFKTLTEAIQVRIHQFFR